MAQLETHGNWSGVTSPQVSPAGSADLAEGSPAGCPRTALAGPYWKQTFAPAGEVIVNPGGEPERDDTGLPPVDIEIPDDARELDRDVQAYYRELRAERRAQRRRGLGKALARDGIVLPLLACCLILALVTGTLLTVFTATSDQTQKNLPGHARSPDTGRSHATRRNSHSARAGAAARPGPHQRAVSPAATSGTSLPSATTASVTAVVHTTMTQLPAGSMTLAGGGQRPFSVLSSAILVLVPSACRCAATVQALATLGMDTRAPTYLVDTPATAAEVQKLAARLSPPTRVTATVATDQNSALDNVAPVAGLTVLIVGSDGRLSWANQLTGTLPFAAVLHALARCPTC